MSSLGIVIAAIKAAASVTAIIGAGTAARVYPSAAPQNAAKPYIVVHRIFERDNELTEGAGKYWMSRIQCDCVAETATAADGLGEALKLALGDIVKQTVGGRSGVDIMIEGTDVSEHSDDRKSFARKIDFYVYWR